MRRLSVGVAVVLLLSLLAMSGVSLAQGTSTNQVIEQVKLETEQIRGLREKSPIQVKFLNRDELKKKLLEDYEEDYPPEERQVDESIMKLLGFLEENQDLTNIMIDILTEQVAGFYDTDEKVLTLISSGQRMSVSDRVTLAHEITHALQDQYFHIDRPPFEDKDEKEELDDDAAFAATALVEGDAMLTMEKYKQGLSLSEQMELQKESSRVETDKLDRAPSYIRESLLFPYMSGFDLVYGLYRAGGFARIDQAFEAPPQSTEQVMHPNKYERREAPIKVELKDIQPLMGAGWELKETDVLGEFDIKELLKTELNDSDSSLGADGWGGCQYRFYQNGEEGSDLMVIDIAWDSSFEAAEFVPYFEGYVEGRLNLKKDSFRQEDGWYLWNGKKYQVALSKRDSHTMIIISDNQEALQAAVSALKSDGEELSDLLQAEVEKSRDRGVSDLGWIVIGVVLGLFVLGLILAVVIILTVMDREKRARQRMAYGGYIGMPPQASYAPPGYPWGAPTPPQPPWGYPGQGSDGEVTTPGTPGSGKATYPGEIGPSPEEAAEDEPPSS